MTQCIVEVILLLGYSIQVILCRMYTGIFVKKKQFINKINEYLLMAGHALALYIDLIIFAEIIPLKLLLMVIIDVIFMCLTYERQILKILFSVFMQFMITVVIDYICPVVISIFIPGISLEVILVSVWGPIMSLLASFIHLAIIVFIKKIVIDKYFVQKNSGGLSKVEWIYFSIFPIVTFLIFLLINQVFDFVENIIQKRIVSILGVGMITMNVAMFFLIKNILKREEKLRESNLFLERVKNETEMYRNISKNYEMQRKRAHEYKNQMTIIAALARDGRIEELNNYLKEYSRDNITKTNVIDTNNVIVNAIINSKYQEAREKNIVFVVKINDLSGLILKDEDIVLILSNLLNNAIEACEKCDNGVIRVKFVKEEKYVLISVENTLCAKPLIIDDAYVTTKVEQKEFHGIGIQNIKETVERYGGQCVIEHNENLFNFTIYIPQ